MHIYTHTYGNEEAYFQSSCGVFDSRGKFRDVMCEISLQAVQLKGVAIQLVLLIC